MQTSAGRPALSVRKSARDREEQIVSAAIAVIGTKGLSKTTLADIARKAGIGYGNLTFRFQTKDKLLIAALRAVLDEYSVHMDAATVCDLAPRDRLRRLVAAAFAPAVTTKNKIALWNAFLSECHTRTAYKRIFEELRRKERDRTLSICSEIIAAKGEARLDAEQATLAINALVEGLWFNMRLGQMTGRQEALAVAMKIVDTIFPDA